MFLLALKSNLNFFRGVSQIQLKVNSNPTTNKRITFYKV